MIMEFVSQDKVSKMLYCQATLDEQFAVVGADDYFYNFMGKTEEICFLEHVHGDCIEEFREAYQSCLTGVPMRLITRVCGADGSYQLVDIVMEQVQNASKGGQVTLTVHNIDSIKAGYMNLSNVAKRYRAYMSMYSDYMFDYDLEGDVITFFKYVSLRPFILFKGPLEEFYRKFVQYGNNAETGSTFQELFRNIEQAKEYFVCSIEGPSVENSDESMKYRIEGTTIYKHNREKVVVGIMRGIGEDEDLTIPYYATAEGKDSFTGLLNKRACEEYVEDAIRADDDRHYMLIIDIDDFKQVNDQHGHLYGDRVIGMVAAIISSTVAGRGITGRFGGDEFFVFTNGIKGDTQLFSMLACLKQRMAEEFAEETCKNVTLSIGVSTYPGDGKDYQTLFEQADAALYEAKRSCKDRYVLAGAKEN